MKKFSKLLNIIFSIVLLIIIFTNKFNAYGQPLDLNNILEILSEGKAAFTTEQAIACAKKIAPMVEVAAGKKFKHNVKIELINREAITEILEFELINQFKNIFPGMTEDQIRSEAEQQAPILSVCLLGKYSVKDNTLYLLPKNVMPIFKLYKIKKEYVGPIIKIIIAHELTHALQDQVIDLGKKINKIKNIDELHAFSSTIEGHAVFIEDIVGRSLKYDDAVIKVSRFFAAGNLKFKDPGLELLNKLISTQFEQIYLGGRQFIEYHYKKGGNEKLWNILAMPPTQTSMITQPETYSPISDITINYAKILEGLEKDFGNRPWSVKNTEVGNMMLNSIYANLEEKKKEEILANIEKAYTMLANCAQPLCMGNVSLLILKDHTFGPKMINTLDELTKNNIENMKNSSLIKINDFITEDLKVNFADIARKISFKINQNNQESLKQTLVRFCRDNVIIEVFDTNIGLGDDDFVRIANKVYERYNSLIKNSRHCEKNEMRALSHAKFSKDGNEYRRNETKQSLTRQNFIQKAERVVLKMTNVDVTLKPQILAISENPPVTKVLTPMDYQSYIIIDWLLDVYANEFTIEWDKDLVLTNTNGTECIRGYIKSHDNKWKFDTEYTFSNGLYQLQMLYIANRLEDYSIRFLGKSYPITGKETLNILKAKEQNISDLHAKDELIRGKAILRLKSYGTKAAFAIPDLIRLLGDEKKVRYYSSYYFRGHRMKRSKKIGYAELFGKQIPSSDIFSSVKPLWQLAREALVSIGEPAVEPLIQTIKNSSSSKIIKRAISTLGEIGDSAAVEWLKYAQYYDNNFEVRYNAAEALDKLNK